MAGLSLAKPVPCRERGERASRRTNGVPQSGSPTPFLPRRTFIAAVATEPRQRRQLGSVPPAASRCRMNVLCCSPNTAGRVCACVFVCVARAPTAACNNQLTSAVRVRYGVGGDGIHSQASRVFESAAERKTTLRSHAIGQGKSIWRRWPTLADDGVNQVRGAVMSSQQAPIVCRNERVPWRANERINNKSCILTL